jgi:RNA polymerase sigma-70 factor (ECF subfamily)
VQPDPIDRDFRTFCERRDPAALAAVFDAAAPRLLLVAMHLCRDAASAEDLVQTVFLQVLRDADRFDRSRPVLPWLLGLLEHRASDLRQRAFVRREQPGHVEAVAMEPSPERAAAGQEVRERVAEALAGMPRDYRDVLALRLVHGLSAVAIAHAHGLPPATVRTRLRRGLQLLRGALPRGLATRGLLTLLAAELVLARDGLGAVRTKVLAAATAGAGATVAVGWWLVLAAALALAAGGVAWAAFRDALHPASADARAPRALAAVPTVPSPPPHADRRGDDEPARVAAAADVVDVANVTTVRGRVVDAAAGTALAGIAVTTHTHPVGGRDVDPGWQDPAPTTTGADGTFAVRLVPSRRRYVEVLFDAEGFVQEAESFEPLRPGVDVDVGDVKLQRGTPVRLRLMCDGEPLGGVRVYARQAPDGDPSGGGRGYGVSDANGIVDLGTCRPGTWSHQIETRHLGAEATFHVPLQSAPLLVDVALCEPPRERSISGVLVDTHGLPVAGIDLGMPMPRSGTLQATTRTDGRFLWSVGALPPAATRERIELPRSKQGELEWVDDGGEVAWGTHGLRLVVRRRAPATLRLEVVDAATQQPVETFGARCDAELGSCSAPKRRVAVERHAGGVATFAVAPGTWYASVFPEPPFAESAELAVEVAEGRTTTLRVPVRPPAELIVDVVDAVTGAPLPGADLALAKAVPPDKARAVASSWYQMLREQPDTTGSGWFGTAVIVVARGTSDRDGRATLTAPPDLPGLVLVVGGPRCMASEHHDVVLPATGARTTVRATAAGVVKGLVVPRAFVERFGPAPERLAEAAAKAQREWTDPGEFATSYPQVVLRPANGGDARAKLEVHVAADGSFALGGVPAGRYTVYVSTVIGSSWTELGPVATVDVEPARELPPLALDVTALVPVRGTVRFFVDGVPAPGRAGLARLVSTFAQPVSFALGPDGTATTPWLVPGTYVPFAVVGDDAIVWGTERVHVPVGGSVAATFALQRRVVAVTIAEADGAPARELFVRTVALDHPELMGAGWCHWLRNRTDEEGRIVLDGAPPGRLRLHAFARDQDLRDRDVEPRVLLGEIAAGAPTATFRMP